MSLASQSAVSAPLRICTLLPSATEIAYSLGLGPNIVGVTHECDYPDGVSQKPNVVNTRIEKYATSDQIDTQVRALLEQGEAVYQLDADTMSELAPDLIVTQGLCEVCALPFDQVVAVANRMESVPTIVSLNPTCLDDVFDDIARVGHATAVDHVASRVINSLRDRVNAVRASVERLTRPRVVCLEWLDPLMIGGHWVPEMVEIAGGKDALGTPGEPTRRVTISEVLHCAPDIILLMPCGFSVDDAVAEASRIASTLDDTPAYRNRQVYAVNANAYFSRSGPRLVDGIELLAKLLHPELSDGYSHEDAVNLFVTLNL